MWYGKQNFEWKFQNRIWNVVEGTIEGNEKNIKTNKPSKIACSEENMERS
jgi:hypothetical protein